MTNTTMGVVPWASQGEGATALSPTHTISTSGLGDLFLPVERRKRAALVYMNAACTKAYRRTNGGPTFEHLHEARCSLARDWEKCVEMIRERGGLLLIGGRA